jgi:hypothetical protein
MQIQISEQMRSVLLQCVKFAQRKNAWISAIDWQGDYEVDTEDAIQFLEGIE